MVRKNKPSRRRWLNRALFQMFGPFRETIQKDGLRLAKVLLSALIGATIMSVFLIPSGMISAGFGGVALLLQNVFRTYFGFEVSYALLNIALNVIPAAVAFFIVGRKFFLFSVVYIVSFSVFVDLIPVHPIVDDIVLNTIFAAALNGVAAAIALNANASGGGTDFIAMIASSKYNVAMWNYVFLFNVVILVISGFLFGAAPAMYSMLFQFLSTQIVNRLHSRYQRQTLFIIANEKEPIAGDLLYLTKHGVTVFEGIGSYSKEKRYLLYTVVSKTDMPLIRRYLRETDARVFMNILDSEQLDGQFYMEPLE